MLVYLTRCTIKPKAELNITLITGVSWKLLSNCRVKFRVGCLSFLKVSVNVYQTVQFINNAASALLSPFIYSYPKLHFMLWEFLITLKKAAMKAALKVIQAKVVIQTKTWVTELKYTPDNLNIPIHLHSHIFLRLPGTPIVGLPLSWTTLLRFIATEEKFYLIFSWNRALIGWTIVNFIKRQGPVQSVNMNGVEGKMHLTDRCLYENYKWAYRNGRATKSWNVTTKWSNCQNSSRKGDYNYISPTSPSNQKLRFTETADWDWSPLEPPSYQEYTVHITNLGDRILWFFPCLSLAAEFPSKNIWRPWWDDHRTTIWHQVLVYAFADTCQTYICVRTVTENLRLACIIFIPVPWLEFVNAPVDIIYLPLLNLIQNAIVNPSWHDSGFSMQADLNWPERRDAMHERLKKKISIKILI